LFRQSPSANRERTETRPHWLEAGTMQFFLLVYFTLLPIVMTIALNWVVYSVIPSYWYQESWMSPALLILASFLAGALIRQKTEDETGGMVLFVIGMIALVLYALLTYYDIQFSIGGVYSRFMPNYLPHSIKDYLPMLPAIGVMGMLAYKAFTLRHYS
jgi:hypothetical protein